MKASSVVNFNIFISKAKTCLNPLIADLVCVDNKVQ